MNNPGYILLPDYMDEEEQNKLMDYYIWHIQYLTSIETWFKMTGAMDNEYLIRIDIT